MERPQEYAVAIELYYDEFLLGEITGVREHQGTMLGTFAGQHTEWNNLPLVRLIEFAEFCHTSYEKTGSPPAIETEEFQAFKDVTDSGSWATVDELGIRRAISRAPLFMGGWDGEVSWVYQDSA